MIKRLRRRFILIAASSVMAVELLVVGLINVIYISQINKRELQLMQILCDNDGRFPEFGKHFDQKPDSRNENVSIPPPEKKYRLGDLGFKVNEETRYQTRYFYIRYDENMNPAEINTGHVAAVTSGEALGYAKEVGDSVFS